MFDFFRRDRKVRNLRHVKRKKEAFYEREMEKADRQNKPDEEQARLLGESLQIAKNLEERIAVQESMYLVSEAERYNVPVPEATPHSRDWLAPPDALWFRLSDDARINLRAAIRAEKAERWKERGHVLPFISAITGLLGVLVAIIALAAKASWR